MGGRFLHILFILSGHPDEANVKDGAMFQKTLAAGLVMLATSPLHAAPLDYQDSLPADVLGMTPREAKLDGDRLIAFYGETVGRATVMRGADR